MDVAATPIALTGNDQQVVTGAGIYRGLCLRETAGAAAIVRVYDGTSASGTLVDQATLAANGDANPWYDGGGIRCPNGIFVDIVSGAVAGSIRIG